jgi:hypothetical protein
MRALAHLDSWDPPTNRRTTIMTIRCVSSALTSKYHPTPLSMALTVHLDRRPRTPTRRTCCSLLQITRAPHSNPRHPRFGTSCVCRGDFRRASPVCRASCTTARRKSRGGRDGGGKGQPTRGCVTFDRKGCVARVGECCLDSPLTSPRQWKSVTIIVSGRTVVSLQQALPVRPTVSRVPATPFSHYL